MTFATQMVLDGQIITNKEMVETIVYTPKGGAAVTIGGIIESDGALFESEVGDGEGTIENFRAFITDNSDATNYPGVAVPDRGDAATIRGKSCKVVAVESKDVDGLWPLMVREVEVIRRTATPNTINRG